MMWLGVDVRLGSRAWVGGEDEEDGGVDGEGGGEGDEGDEASGLYAFPHPRVVQLILFCCMWRCGRTSSQSVSFVWPLFGSHLQKTTKRRSRVRGPAFGALFSPSQSAHERYPAHWRCHAFSRPH